MGERIERAAPSLIEPEEGHLVGAGFELLEQCSHAAACQVREALFAGHRTEACQEMGDAGSSGVEIFRAGEERPDVLPEVERDPDEVGGVTERGAVEPVAEPPRFIDQAPVEVRLRLPRRVERILRPFRAIGVEQQRAERDTRQPALAQQIVLAHRGEAAAGPLEPRLLDEVLHPLARSGPQVARLRGRAIPGNVVVPQVSMVVTSHASPGRHLARPDPETVQEAVAIQPRVMSERLAVKAPITVLLETSRMITTIKGTATTPLITALQNKALIGLIGEY